MTVGPYDACEPATPRNASREEWLAARRSLITASDAAVLTGHHPYSTWKELLQRKVTGDRLEVNPAMWMGTQREASNIQLFGAAAGLTASWELSERLLRSKEHPWAGATLDAFVVGRKSKPYLGVPEELKIELPEGFYERGVVIEAKNVRSKSRSAWTKPCNTPKSRIFHYWAQVQFQMLVTGQTRGVLFAVVDACELYHYPIERNEKYLELLLEAGPRFVRELEENLF